MIKNTHKFSSLHNKSSKVSMVSCSSVNDFLPSFAGAAGGLCHALFALLTVYAYLLSAKVARIEKLFKKKTQKP